LFQEVIRKDDSAKTSSATYANKNVIDSDTSYLNAKLQDSVNISSAPYENSTVSENIVGMGVDRWERGENLSRG